MTAPEGPFLYDDDPAPLHTGTPRNRNGLILALLGGTLLFSVGMVLLMTLTKGTGSDQAEEVAGVFTKALAAGDTETAYQLICDAERGRITPDELAGAYLQPGSPEVTGARIGKDDEGEPLRYVSVRWDDAGTVTTTELTVVPEGGTKVCGTRSAG